MKKTENYINAVDRLNEAIIEYSLHPENDIIQDGLIQRFEFTIELAWKSLKEYMEEYGASLQSALPKMVLKEAYASNLIDDDEIWNEMLKARNWTSHIYSRELSKSIADKIAGKYYGALARLKEFYIK